MEEQKIEQIHGDANVQHLLERTKLNILIYIALISFITAGLTLLIRIFFYKELSSATFVTGLNSLTFLALGVYLVKTRNILVGSIIFHCIAFTIAPLRIFQTGGTLSPLILVYVLHCTVAFSVNGKRFGGFVLGWSIFSIIVMTYLGYRIDLIVSPFLTSSLGAGAAALLMLFLLMLPIVFVLEEKDILKDRLLRLEKKESAYVIMRRLTHEYGNYLNIALGYVDLVKKDREDPKAIEKVQKSLGEMDKILKGLVKISDEGDLVEHLKRAEKEVNILKTFTDDTSGLRH